MDLEKIVTQLRAERRKIDRAIAALEELTANRSPVHSKRKRGSKSEATATSIAKKRRHPDPLQATQRLAPIIHFETAQRNLESFPMQDEPEGGACFQHKMSLKK